MGKLVFAPVAQASILFGMIWSLSTEGCAEWERMRKDARSIDGIVAHPQRWPNYIDNPR